MSCAAPSRAPANFRDLAAVTEVASSSFHTEWVGSGAPVEAHPATRATDNATCSSCEGTNTVVIWARIETTPYGPSGWGADTHELAYELHCRECQRFTQHARAWYPY